MNDKGFDLCKSFTFPEKKLSMKASPELVIGGSCIRGKAEERTKVFIRLLVLLPHEYSNRPTLKYPEAVADDAIIKGY